MKYFAFFCFQEINSYGLFCSFSSQLYLGRDGTVFTTWLSQDKMTNPYDPYHGTSECHNNSFVPAVLLCKFCPVLAVSHSIFFPVKAVSCSKFYSVLAISLKKFHSIRAVSRSKFYAVPAVSRCKYFPRSNFLPMISNCKVI